MRSLIIFTLIIVISCNSNPEADDAPQHQERSETPNDNARSASGETCYWQIMQRDTLVAALKEDGASITGKLTFDNFQKDGSSGTVTGKVDGAILKLWYSFQSEGMNSVMEVWYNKQGDELLRGIGPSGVKNDTSYFTDPAAITFDPNQRLQKVNCSELPEKYK